MPADGLIASEEFDGKVSKRFAAYLVIAAVAVAFLIAGYIHDSIAFNKWKEQHQINSDKEHDKIRAEFILAIKELKQEELLELERLKSDIEDIKEHLEAGGRVERVINNKLQVPLYRLQELETKLETYENNRTK